MSSQHNIQKLVLDYTYTAGVEKATITEQMRQQFYAELLPLLTTILDEKNGHEELVISKLEIDLGAVKTSELPYKLVAEFEHEITIQLENAQSKNKNEESIDDRHALLFFLQHGVFPSYYKNVAPKPLFDKLLSSDPDSLSAIVALLGLNQATLRRFLLQFTAKQHIRILQAATIADARNLVLACYAVLAKLPAVSIDAFLPLFYFALKSELFSAKKDLIEAFVEKVVEPFAGKNIFTEVEKNGAVSTLTEAVNNKETSAAIENILVPIFQKKVFRKEAKNIQESAFAEGKNEETTLNKIFVVGAGLVLLHPFLEMFFTELKLVQNGQFISLAKQRKAVQVLHYLAFGSRQTSEHLLALPKILCGVSMAMPISAKLRLTTKEKTDCGVLLEAVLKHWKPLQGSTIQGLQTSFLQRDGLLLKNDNEWTLHIERKTIDILLDEVPWSFGLIQFP